MGEKNLILRVLCLSFPFLMQFLCSSGWTAVKQQVLPTYAVKPSWVSIVFGCLLEYYIPLKTALGSTASVGSTCCSQNIMIQWNQHVTNDDFWTVKKELQSQKFVLDQKVTEVVQEWLYTTSKSFFHDRIWKLVMQWAKFAKAGKKTTSNNWNILCFSMSLYILNFPWTLHAREHTHTYNVKTRQWNMK